jgi:hypothetical protein
VRLTTLPGAPSRGSCAKLTLRSALRLPPLATMSACSAAVTLVTSCGSGVWVLTIARTAVPSNTRFDAACTVSGVNIFAVDRRLEDVVRCLGRGHGLVDVDGLDQVVGELHPRFDRRGGDALLHRRFDLGDFAVDLGLGRRGGLRIGDHAAHVAQRGSPNPRRPAAR